MLEVWLVLGLLGSLMQAWALDPVEPARQHIDRLSVPEGAPDPASIAAARGILATAAKDQSCYTAWAPQHKGQWLFVRVEFTVGTSGNVERAKVGFQGPDQ